MNELCLDDCTVYDGCNNLIKSSLNERHLLLQ